MGRKNDQPIKAKADKPKEEEETPEDPPILKELKALDDKYLELEREYEKAVHKLEREYNEKKSPFLVQRKDILCKSTENTDVGTPGLPGFWLEALKNHPAFGDAIFKWDEPVLEYLRDVTSSELSEDDPKAGFKLVFHFAENPYFTNETLVKEYQTEESSPYTGSTDVKKIQCTEIEWKAGKDVTVDKAPKKVKGGGAKKNKQKGKEKAEPRESFFRWFFRNMEEGMELPEDLDLMGLDLEDVDDADEEEIIDSLMEQDLEVALGVKDQIIPFAIRWYTGEAASDDEDDDEDEEEEDEDDDEDDEESDEEPASKKKVAAKKGKSGGSPIKKPEADPKKTEECKQQ